MIREAPQLCLVNGFGHEVVIKQGQLQTLSLHHVYNLQVKNDAIRSAEFLPQKEH